MSTKRLGDLLLESGVLTPDQLQTALKEQKTTQQRLGKVLIKLKLLDEDRLCQALAKQAGYPVVELDKITIEPATANLLPKDFCLKNQVLPIQQEKNRLTLAMVDPFDMVALDQISMMTGLETEIKVTRESELLSAIEKYCSQEPELEKLASRAKAAESKETAKKEENLKDIPPGTPLNKLKIHPDVLRLVPKEFCIANRVLPLLKDEGTLTVAITDLLDIMTLDMLRIMTATSTVKPLAYTEEEILTTLSQCYPDTMELAEVIAQVKQAENLEVVGDNKAKESKKALELKELQEKSESGPIIRLANSIIIDAIKAGSSDIHIEPREAATQIRYRVDGLLRNVSFLPSFIHVRLISRLKIMSGMDIAESRAPQDGRCRIRMGKNECDLRLSTIPTFYGEKMVIRILNPQSALIGLEDIGLSSRDVEVVKSIIAARQGAFLVTGPTGSGKSSTLFAVIGRIKSETKNIITLEDPIEYDIADINQVQVNERAGITFSSGLRSILRQDPDVVMVGEIRDSETAEIAFHAAMTGHLVLSTLHTNDAPTTVIRLTELGVTPYLIAAALKSIIAQRLVRKICPKCKEPCQPSPQDLSMLGILPDKKLTFYRGKGCEHCGNSGYKGRVGIFEILVLNDAVRELIYQHANSIDIAKEAQKNGMKPLIVDAVDKIIQGITTVEEVLRVISLEECTISVRICPQCQEQIPAGEHICPGCSFDLDKTNCLKCGKTVEKGCDLCADCQTKELAPSTQPAPEIKTEKPEKPEFHCPECGGAVKGGWLKCPACESSLGQEANRLNTPKCPVCSQQVESPWKICPYCGGALLAKTGNCPQCRQEVKPEWKSCPFCGGALKHEPPSHSFCPSCGNKLNPGWLSCPFCSYSLSTPKIPLKKNCPNCGKTLKPDWKTCPYCQPKVSQPEPPLKEAEVIPFRKSLEVVGSPGNFPQIPRILVVAEDSNMLVLVKKILEDTLFEVFLATNAKDGLQKALSFEPQLIILDEAMPDFSAFKLSKRLKETGTTEKIPLIILVNPEKPQEEAHILESGADDFLSKPLQREMVLAKVNLTLRKLKSEADKLKRGFGA